jgi:hypothetical protein
VALLRPARMAILCAVLLCAGDAWSQSSAAPAPAAEPVKRKARRVGSLSKEVIWRVINQSVGAFRGCWEQALERDPECRNNVLTVRFVIDPRGRVASTERIGEPHADAQLERCLLAAFAALKFPEPENDGYVIVTFPSRMHCI